MRAIKINLLVIVFGLSGLAQAAATPINLNDFFADPSVTVAADGSSAALAEDASLSPVLLSNDPGLGDPEVVIAGLGLFLLFDFDFVEGLTGEADEFGAFLIDAGTGLSVGAMFEFFTQNTSMGSISFDLSGLVGTTLGLQFQLSALPGDTGLDSMVTVSNVRLQSVMVSEPSTLALMLSGLAIGWLLRRRARARSCGTA